MHRLDAGDERVAVALCLLHEARRTTLAPYGTLTPTSDGTHFAGSFDDLDGLARWLILLKRPFIIHHPPELRTALRQRAQEIAALAEVP